jgi:hypothetical protein
MQTVNEALSGASVFPIEFVDQEDVGWSAYDALAATARGDGAALG